MTEHHPNIAVIGAGLMGHGIALTFARAGCSTSVYDPNSQTLHTLNDRLADSMNMLAMTPQECSRTLARVSVADRLDECVVNADVVVEAAPENLQLKQQIFADVEALAPANCILASNTSVIPITDIMASLQRKERALGTHWWNPPHLIPLVEVIRTQHTAPQVIETMMSLLETAGKTAVRVEKDIPGFIGNRLQHALWREAISLVENGVCDAGAVDTVINASFGRRLSVLGPLANADLVGTDLTLAIHETVLGDLENSPKPSPFLEALVEGGQLGMKSGQGFYHWTPQEADAVRQTVSSHLRKLETILE